MGGVFNQKILNSGSNMSTTATTRSRTSSGGSSTGSIRDPYENDFSDQHPALKSVCVVNCDNTTRLIPNSVPQKLENECFEGNVMLLIRTPDADDPKEAKDNMGEIPLRISEYLKPKNRRFEFQFQIKLKKVPTGPLFLGCELEHPIKISRLTKGLTGVLLAMIRRINSGFHYSWGLDPAQQKADPTAWDEGRYEKTHLSFPVEASMDRIVITKPGEDPPELGHELFESDASVKRRRKMGSGSVDWNTEDTYTMCLWSAYCDWIKWKSLNVPGVRPFSLGNVTGSQPIYLSVYEINNMSADEYKKRRPNVYHYRKDLLVYTRLEFSNFEKTEGGLVSKLYERKGYCNSEFSAGETDSVGSEPDTESSDGSKN